MVTDTLLNSLKSLFSSLGAKTSDSNYAVGLFDKTSGEPKGLMGMSDLATVLDAEDLFNVAANDGNLSTLVSALCTNFLNKSGLFISNWYWTSHGGGYQAIVASQRYGGESTWNVAGHIFDYSDGTVHHFFGKYDGTSWTYKIDQ